ncbi:hypothetical protein ABZ468_42985 [Streptomyces sp. NPDC005708]|uniref:hypothetical protein n=1 Tax=Streptomyces sp. NPDC005708 TaxID=3154564 RepID=UPI0033E53539
MDDAGRYRVTVSTDDEPVMHGWWNNEATARRKFSAAIGNYGRDGMSVVLVDTEMTEQLATWP